MLLCSWSSQILRHPLHGSTSHCDLPGHRHCKGRQKLTRTSQGPAPSKSLGIIMENAKASESCRVGWMSVCEAVRPRPFTGGKFTPVKDSEKQAQQSIYIADGQNECHGDQVVVTATYSFSDIRISCCWQHSPGPAL